MGVGVEVAIQLTQGDRLWINHFVLRTKLSHQILLSFSKAHLNFEILDFSGFKQYKILYLFGIDFQLMSLILYIQNFNLFLEDTKGLSSDFEGRGFAGERITHNHETMPHYHHLVNLYTKFILCNVSRNRL